MEQKETGDTDLSSPSGDRGMQPTLYYCYDAYCGWCYGFSNVITGIATEFKEQLVFDVLSGGMLFDENPKPISAMAGYISQAYKNVERLTGVTFGESYLWHINNPDQSDWFPESTRPAIALCIFKEYLPEEAIQIAAALQYALHFEGRDLTDDEAYRHLVQQYGIPENEFYQKLRSDEYREKAYYEFALVKQLGIKGFPCVLLQVSDSKFYLVAQGYTDYETVKGRINAILVEVNGSNPNNNGVQ